MAILTYADLQNRVLRSLDEAGDTGTTIAIAKDYLQVAHSQRVASRTWNFMLWPDVATFTTLANTRYYSLHQEFGRMLWMRNRGTKDYLREAPFRQLEALGVDWLNDTGRADRFALTTRMPVQAQPTASSTVSIVSTSASDTTPTVIVRGMTANGVTTETLTANGISTVTSTNSFTTILQATKTGTWVGRVTLSAGSTTLLTLFPTENGRSYQQLELLRIPTAGDVVEYRFARQPSILSNDNDLPDIPPPFQELVVYDALLLMAGYNTELKPAAAQVWAAQRDRLLEGLEQSQLEGQSIGSEVRYVRYLGDDNIASVPRITSS